MQILAKLFNLKLKYDDPITLVFDFKIITRDIDATGVKIDLPPITFIKALYPTYSHYLESLKPSDQLKSIIYDSLMEKIVECEKEFGKKNIA